MLWVPVGFAHGFLALEDQTEVLYKTTEYYHPEWDAGVRWDDPALAIPWPGTRPPLVSEKDGRLPLLKDIDSPFEYREGDP
jgi:dTDP-4-dehydrorhamnose 3,5-epimerase